jgi:uncharacterized membrane protein
MTRVYAIATIILIVVVFLVTLYVYPQLPEQVPVHWNLEGKVDDYGDKTWASFLLPGAMLLILGLMKALPWLSPKPFAVDSFRTTYAFVMFLCACLFAYIQGLLLWNMLHEAIDTSRAFLAGLFLFFALLGNVLGKVKRNFWIGIRTPWTLANERVWNDTHRFAARVFVAVGILGFITTIAGVTPIFAVAIFMVAVLITAVYSRALYKRLERAGKV